MTKDIFAKILKQSKLSRKTFIFDKNITYANFYNLSQKYFEFLKKKKLKKNSVICLKIEYSIDFIAIIFAAYLNKNPVTILNPNCTKEEEKHVLKSSKSSIFFFERNQNRKGLKIHFNSGNVFFYLLNNTNTKILNKNDRFIIFTSGTTSKPKGAVLTTSSFSNNVSSICENLKLKKTDKTVIFSPPAYAMGISQIFTFMYTGAKISFYNDGLKFPYDLINKIIDLNITKLNISVSAFRILSRFINKKNKFNSIKTIMSGGMPLTKEVFLKYKKIFKKANIVNFYGCTENSPRITHHKINVWKSSEAYLSVGKPLKNIKIKIFKKIKSDKFGEIMISGLSLMRGYLINDKIVKNFYNKKWFNTGDLGYFDKSKNLYLKGRSDNIFSVGHEKLYPEEIESIIKKIFKFSEVVVVKKAHKILNWVPIAVIEPGSIKKIDIDYFSKKCKKYISSFKVPKQIIYKKIPRNNYGKIDRKKIENFIK